MIAPTVWLPRRSVLFSPLLIVALGCAPPARVTTATPAAACVLGAVAAPAESVTVALAFDIDPAHAPLPANAAERFAFAQVYETLMNVDCDGHAYAGLARSWTTDATHTRVTLTLRDDARFANGDPVGARDVVAAWRTTGDSPGETGALARRVAGATTIFDERTLMVSLPDTDSRVLADPALVVYRAAPGSSWPEGSGPYRAARTVSGRLTLEPVGLTPGPRIAMRRTRGGDARDAIDAGVDLIAAADPSAVRYAEARSDLVTMPLPWSRTYALAVPRRTPDALPDALLELRAPAADSADAFRVSLARDAVRADARAADSPAWWGATSGCAFDISHVKAPTAPVAATRRRIIYSADDRVARQIAERLVALGRSAIAAPLAPSDFARTLRVGDELAYVIALPRAPLAPCHDRSVLLASAPWLEDSVGIARDQLIPLVDTRERAIVRRGRIAAVVDWDGTLRLRGGRSQP